MQCFINVLLISYGERDTEVVALGNAENRGYAMEVTGDSSEITFHTNAIKETRKYANRVCRGGCMPKSVGRIDVARKEFQLGPQQHLQHVKAKNYTHTLIFRMH